VGGDQVSNYCQQAEEEDNMGARKIRSLSLHTSNHSTLNDNAVVVLAEIARLERRIFPKHESLAGDFSQEVKKRNQKLLYVIQGDVVTEQKEHEEEKLDPTLIAGYLMYSWSSLAASITKLAGYILESLQLEKAMSLSCVDGSCSRTSCTSHRCRTKYLELSFFRESCRRQGYGEALLQSAIQQIQARKLQCVNLHVDPTRVAAVALYEKIGFHVDTVVHSYYAPNRDAYRMVLELTS
jgi:GNAT superfamily N-acetyltransferase